MDGADVRTLQRHEAAAQALRVEPERGRALAIEAEIGASELRASKQLRESFPRRVTIDVTIVIQPFAESKMTTVNRRYRRPDDSGRIDFLDNFQRIGVDPVKRAKITRAHPKLLSIPRQCLRCHGGRPMAFYIRNFVHA